MDKITVKIRRVPDTYMITSIPIRRNNRKVGFEFTPGKDEFEVDPDVAAAAVALRIDGKAVFEVVDAGGVTRLGDQAIPSPAQSEASEE